MNGMEAVLWIASLGVGLRKSQTKTLGDLLSAAMQIGRVSLSELQRSPAEEGDGAAKHAIKRAWRFTANDRVHVSDAAQGPLRRLFHCRKRRTLPRRKEPPGCGAATTVRKPAVPSSSEGRCSDGSNSLSRKHLPPSSTRS